MTQLILIFLVGIGLYFGWRVIKREMSRVGGALKKTDDTAPPHKHDAETLEQDKNGVYRPKK